jgi:hypothetical protein
MAMHATPGGASVGAAKDLNTGAMYFYKSTGHWGLDMLLAEYEGIKEMHEVGWSEGAALLCVCCLGLSCSVSLISES